LLTSALRALFKDYILRNYSLKKYNVSIFDALNAQVPIKTYYLKSLKSALRTLVNISLFLLISLIVKITIFLSL